MFKIKPENLTWTSEEELVANAKGLRDLYYFNLGFWTQGKTSEYEQELNDWLVWLEITAELHGRILPIRKYIAKVVPPARQRYFPKPSELIDDTTIHAFREAMDESANLDFTFFARELKEMCDIRHLFDLGADGTIEYSQRDQLADEFIEHVYRRKVSRNQVFYLENYIISDYFRIHDIVCDEHMFIRAVMDYYPEKEMFHQHPGLSRFFEIFEPIAKDVYFKLTDTSSLDFQEIAKLAAKKFGHVLS